MSWQLAYSRLHTDSQLPEGMAKGQPHLYRSFSWAALLQSEAGMGHERAHPHTLSVPGLRVPFLRSLGLRLRDPTVVVAISQTDGNYLFNLSSRDGAKSLCFSLELHLPGGDGRCLQPPEEPSGLHS